MFYALAKNNYLVIQLQRALNIGAAMDFLKVALQSCQTQCPLFTWSIVTFSNTFIGYFLFSFVYLIVVNWQLDSKKVENEITWEIRPRPGKRILWILDEFGSVVPSGGLFLGCARTWVVRMWADRAGESFANFANCVLLPKWTPPCCGDNDHKDEPKSNSVKLSYTPTH